MLGCEIAHHGPQVSVNCINVDPASPATAHLPKVWTISQEEIYQFKNYDPAKVHDLLILEKHPESGAPGITVFPGAKITARQKKFSTPRSATVKTSGTPILI
jgi:hypothetical protein